MKTNTITR